MNETSDALPKAKIEKSRLSLFLWLIPSAAALLCAWYVCQDIIFVGPTITIYFQNAEGFQEQNSLMQYRGGGIDFHLGLFSGAKLTAESAQTLISGGIAFATPPDFKEVASHVAVFSLNEKSDAEWGKWSPAIPLHAVPKAMPNKTPLPNLIPSE